MLFEPIPVILLKHPKKFSTNDEICISLDHESKLQRQADVVLQCVLHLKSKVRHLSAL